MFHGKRLEVRGCVGDQGTEKDIIDGTVDIIPRFANAYDMNDDRSCMCPNALGFAGMLHILYNALEENFKAMSC